MLLDDKADRVLRVGWIEFSGDNGTVALVSALGSRPGTRIDLTPTSWISLL